MCDSEYLAELIDDRYQLGVGAKDHVSEANLLFVYKVYLARKITYTFTDASVVAAAAATVAKGGAATAKPIQVDAATIQQILATKDAQMISAAAQLLNAQGQSVSSSTTPNSGQFGFAGVRAEGVSFEQTFARPVVIGYEAISRHGDYVFGSAMTPSPGGGIPLGGAPVLTPTQ